MNKSKMQLLRETFEQNPGRSFSIRELQLLLPLSSRMTQTYINELEAAHFIRCDGCNYIYAGDTNDGNA